jgi:integrase
MMFGTHRVNFTRRKDILNSSWFMSVYLQRKEYRKSLRTVDIAAAKQLANQQMIKLLLKVEQGQKVFSTTLGDARKEYLKDLDRRVAIGITSPVTAKHVTRRIQLGMKFLDQLNPKLTANHAIDSIHGKLWEGFAEWRLKTGIVKKLLVINGELVSIRAMFKFARDKGWCGEKNIPVNNIQVEAEGSKRRRITDKQFHQVTQALTAWVKANKTYSRQLVLTVFKTMAETGMRTGECVQLLNSDLDIHNNEVTITIRAATSKVRKTRQIFLAHSPAVWLLDWIKHIQVHKKPSDYVFCPEKNGSVNGDAVFYGQYNGFRHSELKKLNLEWVDPYYCRHMFATRQLLSGAPIHLVARVIGSSVAMIEKTYDQLITSMVSKELGKKKAVYDAEGRFEKVIDRK